MKKLFGTDGMRGAAGVFPLDADTMWTTGASLARQLGAQTARAPRIVMGRDTRESGAWLETALSAGARAGGAQVESAGIITTPGVAYLARTLAADAGVVISASHNPFEDNGVKIFAPSGRKLDDATERLIEADIYAARANAGAPRREPAQASDTVELQAHAAELRARYLAYLAEEVGAGLALDGLKLVVDCAHGAAFELGPALFARLGAQVTAVNDAPDGRNINRAAGSLYVEQLGAIVVAAGAELGVAFDGDADRALFVDAHGAVVDGDATLWVMAQHMAAGGELAHNLVVATVMSNIGLELALKARGLELLRTDVGDKYVLEELLRTGAQLGGEQSGHIIFPRLSLAGDGLVTTLCLLRALRTARLPLHELSAGFTRYPQVLVNVRVGEKRPFADVPEIAAQARATEAQLAGAGRLLLRYSGTEPLARVMIEGARQDEIEQLAHALAKVISAALGTG
ncbi:MAG TPA: phosphoglucosamine mutase [Pyrinomonadaceae bacterium]|nr:phosphoglucosamine mutase [Pyrinomonadaceae bacterium]